MLTEAHALADQLAKVLELVGVAIIIGGSVIAGALFVREGGHGNWRTAYDKCRSNLGRSILLGLEVLIIADIVRTIIVDPTPESVAVLGAIVVIRILLSFSLEVEIDGAWPWRRARLASRPDAVGRRAYDAMVEAFTEQGLIIRITGDTIALTPPLIVSEREIEEIFGKVARVIRAVA